MTVAEAQTLCLKQGTPFYSYRLPGERESVFGAQLDCEVAPFRQVGEQGKGFILVPFAESEEVPAWFIRGDITFREVTTDIEIRTGLSGTMGLTDIKPGQEPDISWEEYESQVAAMVAALKQGQVRKMVLSRTITLQERAYEKAAVWYTALADRYPEAFVFLVFVPGKTCDTGDFLEAVGGWNRDYGSGGYPKGRNIRSLGAEGDRGTGYRNGIYGRAVRDGMWRKMSTGGPLFKASRTG